MLPGGGVRLYFENDDLHAIVDRQAEHASENARLQPEGATFTSQPALMPWDCKARLPLDPDGHEVSLYSAGENASAKHKLS